ncbi:MAG: hypothetical protein LC130_11870 [Bryobacterales bacterium]|nr:hypothetical protein [Bryobacterales bacterium]
MKIRLMVATVTVTLLLLGCMQLMAHDDKIHKATVGAVAAATADGFDLKTKTGIVKVKYSSKTKFERNEKPAEKSHMRQGERVGVIGSKMPTGEIMANEILLGVPAPKPKAQ